MWLMVGLPGSGKSTYARKHLAGKWRVCLDDIRCMLSVNDPYNPSFQPVAVAVEEAIIRQLLAGVGGQRRDIVVDATNITRDRRRRYLRMAASCGVKAIAVCIQCNVATALERNKKRSDPVPEEVIRRMYDTLQPPTLSEGFEDIVYVLNQ